MKKMLVLLATVVGVVGLVMVQQTRRDRAEAELWAEATDPLSPSVRRPGRV